MFTYNRLNLLTSIGLESSLNYYNQVQGELKPSPQLRETINQITTALNLDPLTDQELEDSLSTLRRSHGARSAIKIKNSDEYFQVQLERIDILETTQDIMESIDGLIMIDLQLLLDDIIIGSIFLIAPTDFSVNSKKTALFREVITSPAYRIVANCRRVPGILRLLLNELENKLCPELDVEALISDPFENVTDMLIDRFGFQLNRGNTINFYIPGIGVLRSYDVYKELQ